MSNQAEIDYEKQFQDDLAKATALSLEQQALDEYRRSKKYGTSVSISSSASTPYYERSQYQTPDSSSYYSQHAPRHRPGSIHTSRGSSSEATPPPIAGPPSAPQRRHSEVVSSAAAAAVSAHDSRSKTPPPESDLISFASPTTKKPEHSTFEKLIEDLQKMQTTQTSSALVPLGPIAAAAPQPVHHPHNVYRPAVAPTAMYAPQYGHAMPPGAGGGMQLVPFTPPPQQQKVPLTQEELQKLYNMPQQQQHAAYPHAMGFVAPAPAAMPYQTPYPQSAPVIGVGAAPTAAYMPPHYPTPYGFQHGAVATPASYYQPASTTPQTAPPTLAATTGVGVGGAGLVAQIPKSHSTSSVGNTNGGAGGATATGGGPSGSSSSNNLRRQTPPARKRTGTDLIDLSHEDDSRVSVLEAFDPLHQDDDDYVWKK